MVAKIPVPSFAVARSQLCAVCFREAYVAKVNEHSLPRPDNKIFSFSSVSGSTDFVPQLPQPVISSDAGGVQDIVTCPGTDETRVCHHVRLSSWDACGKEDFCSLR